MKIYVAAPYPTIDVARDLRDDLVARGYEVTSRWLDTPSELNNTWAQNDLDDVAAADMLVVINDEEWANKGTGGRHTELGYALGIDKPVIVVGPRTQVFHYLDRLIVVQDFDELVTKLESME